MAAARKQESSFQQKPATLCVDLDGTFLRTETAIENLLTSFRKSPFAVIRSFLRLAIDRNVARFKGDLARLCPLDPQLLPASQCIINYIKEARSEGRQIILATAAPNSVARAIADVHPLFDQISASDDLINNKGARKASRLAKEIEDGDYEYIGDSRADIAVWKCARRQRIVAPAGKARRDLLVRCPDLEPLTTEASRPWAFLHGLRLHQWSKNLLVFIPAAAAYKLTNESALILASIAFLSTCLMVSAVYLLNDCFDVEDDRRHPHKKLRPCATGDLSLRKAIVTSGALLAGAFLLSLLLPLEARCWLLIYFIVSLLYTLWLKRVFVVDVAVLSGLYTVRLMIGGAATAVECSVWMLIFSSFCFLSLALLKRFTEVGMFIKNSPQNPFGRSYHLSSYRWLPIAGAASAAAAALTILGYAFDPRTKHIYSTPMVLVLASPIIAGWFFRMWRKAQKEKMSSDPVIFALKDWFSYFALALLFAIALVSR